MTGHERLESGGFGKWRLWKVEALEVKALEVKALESGGFCCQVPPNPA
jgi:hypothetical protein